MREKDAAWSPDGKWIAYISDQTGEEEVYVVAQDGKGQPVQLTTGSSSFHFAPVWSPDSKKLAWADRGMRLHVLEVATKKPVEVDKATMQEITDYTFSPDSSWLAYTKRTENGFQAIFLYGLADKKTTQATDADGSYGPAFDPDGKYLYFLSDREVNPTLGNYELSYTVNKVTRPHALVLRADLPSPFAPRSDEVKPAEEKKKEDAKKEEDKKKEEKGDKPAPPSASTSRASGSGWCPSPSPPATTPACLRPAARSSGCPHPPRPSRTRTRPRPRCASSTWRSARKAR